MSTEHSTPDPHGPGFTGGPPMTTGTSPDLAPGHGGNSGLCFDDHTCPACEAGRSCVDLFEHPICGTVACTADEMSRDPGESQGLASLNWDSPDWGQSGHNVHTSAWAPDGTHDDITEDQ